MFTLLVFVLLSAVAAQSTDNTVRIHEWGVVELDQEYQGAIGALRGYLDDEENLNPYEMYEVEAPVIWFHGAECTGTLTVTANSGFITTAVPWYDGVEVEEATGIDEPGSQTASWYGLRITVPGNTFELHERYAENEEEVLGETGAWDGFEYALPYWRTVPGNTIQHPLSGYSGSFLYYECSFRDMNTYAEELYGYQGVYLLFFMDDFDLICSSALTDMEMDARGAVLDDEALLEVLAEWSGGGLEISELQALWDTWRPAIRYRCGELGQTVMLFPLSERQTESICSIDFKPDREQQVEYHRLFLGLGQIGDGGN